MKYLIDAHAWIEYLEGSTQVKKVKEIFEGSHEVLVLTLTMAEVVSKFTRKGYDPTVAWVAMAANAVPVELSARQAKEAGKTHAEIRKKIPNFGLVDAILLTIARDLKAKVVTGDTHFKGFKETVFLN